MEREWGMGEVGGGGEREREIGERGEGDRNFS